MLFSFIKIPFEAKYINRKVQFSVMADKVTRLTVDVVVSDGTKVVLIQRKNEPFQGAWALPGGFVDYGETVEQAALREVKEETGLDVELEGLLGVYSGPDRDPRGHTVSVVFFAKKKKGKLKAGSDASDVMEGLIAKVDKLQLAFDHAIIIEDYKIIMMDIQGVGNGQG